MIKVFTWQVSSSWQKSRILSSTNEVFFKRSRKGIFRKNPPRIWTTSNVLHDCPILIKIRLKSEFARGPCLARSSVFHLSIMLKCCPPLYSAADSRAPYSKCRQRLQYAECQNKFLSILLENASHALRKLLKVISAVKIRSVWQSVHNLSCYWSCDDFILCSIPTSFPLNYLHNVFSHLFCSMTPWDSAGQPLDPLGPCRPTPWPPRTCRPNPWPLGTL